MCLSPSLQLTPLIFCATRRQQSCKRELAPLRSPRATLQILHWIHCNAFTTVKLCYVQLFLVHFNGLVGPRCWLLWHLKVATLPHTTVSFQCCFTKTVVELPLNGLAVKLTGTHLQFLVLMDLSYGQELKSGTALFEAAVQNRYIYIVFFCAWVSRYADGIGLAERFQDTALHANITHSLCKKSRQEAMWVVLNLLWKVAIQRNQSNKIVIHFVKILEHYTNNKIHETSTCILDGKWGYYKVEQ